MPAIPVESNVPFASRFDGLTSEQQSLLTFDGWAPGTGWPEPARADAEALIARKMLIEIEVPAGEGPVYAVPLDVHMDWCQHCSEIEGAGAR